MDLTLSQQDLGYVRRLLLAEPEPGSLLPRAVIDALAHLLPCDAIGVGEADAGGYRLRGYDLPHAIYDYLSPQVCDGPLVPGIQHVVETRADLRDGPVYYGIDMLHTIRLGRATPAGTVVQLYLDRQDHRFTPRDLTLFLMLEPVLSRLLDTRPRLAGDETLSSSELRVLELVASGSSNRDVAEHLCVSTATVRKHLEHCYRKLGVTNRTAAVAALTHGAPRDLVSPFG